MTGPIVFMHMAKTAGSSVNRFFADRFGREACAFHLERHAIERRREIAREARFVSGHVYALECLGLAGEDGYAFTVARDPLGQIASHLRWLDRYADPALAAERSAFNGPLRALVDRVGATDLRDPEALDALMADLPPWGLRMLDNMQARYLCGAVEAVPLSLAHARRAVATGRRFARIGWSGDLRGTLADVAADLGLAPPEDAPPRENVATGGRGVDLSVREVRLALERRIPIDREVLAALRPGDVDPAG